jgi:hypothetical protein
VVVAREAKARARNRRVVEHDRETVADGEGVGKTACPWGDNPCGS